jgi:uncharacterized protein YndB with AHSA1/START domain
MGEVAGTNAGCTTKGQSMSEPLKDLVHSIDIDAPRTVVWGVLTSPASVPQWLGCINYEGREGHTFHMQPDAGKRAAGDIEGATHCDVEETVTPELFRFSWYMPGTPKTTVAIRLEPLGGARTRATLTHSGWDQFPPEAVKGFRDALDAGWKSSVLPNLKAACEAAGRQQP